ncbi:MAG: response regulator [Synergistaceae bacterium]|nr:response regulator [Synergistaceae bacterium]
MAVRVTLRTVLRANRAQLVFVFLAFLLMVTASSFFVNDIVEKHIFSTVERALITADASIGSSLEKVRFLLMEASFSVQRRLESGESQEQIRRYIREYSEWLARYVGNSLGVVTLLGYVRGELVSGAGWTPPESFMPQQRSWYVEARKNPNEVVFTEPCIDPMSGKPVISVAKVLRGSNGEDYGVIAVDMGMSVISEYVRTLRFDDGGYGLLLDRELDVIIHPEDGYFGRRAAELGDFPGSASREKGNGQATFPPVKLRSRTGESLVIVLREMENGWYIGIATPTWSYYGDVYFMTLVLSALGAAFMLILSGFLIRLSGAKMRSDEENRSKSSFLARMSHEIRTPMNSILGMSELVMRRNIAPDVREYISIIHRSGISLLSIINDILDFSRIESGRLTIESRKYQLSSLMNDLINAIRLRVAAKRLDFFVDVDGDLPAELVGDDVKVRQIALNLLTNAVKYTDAGFVSLKARRGSSEARRLELVFEVEDSGIGIKKEDMKNLFVDFSRLDDGYRKHIEGTGLGLVIARSCCRLMGGDISVSSEYGRGSTFTATVVQEFENERKAASVEEAERKRVLLYEERPRHLRAVVRGMEELGLTPVRPASPVELAGEIGKGGYDCAFIPPEYAADCVAARKKYRASVRLVAMVEWNEIATFRDIPCMILPAYSMTIANAINGIPQGVQPLAEEGSASFSAPTARVLIVDDLETNLMVAKDLLLLFALEVHTCKSGHEALSLVQNNHYDVVFMDHMMPGMDGLEATAALRALGGGDEYYLKLPVVALTANAISGQEEMFLQNGMNDFLAKPIEIQKLARILKKWIPGEKQIEKRIEKQAETSDEGPAGHDDFRVEGLDAAAGLGNSGGNAAGYRNVLLEFCREARAAAVNLGEAERAENIEKYTILAHSLKGISRSVGATDLGAFAARLEESAKKGDISAIHARTGAFLESLRALLDGVSSALTGDKTPNPSDSFGKSDLRESLNALNTALTDMDMETVNGLLAKYTTLPLDPETKNAVSEIEQDILMCEYEKALEKIEELQQGTPLP